MIMSIENFEKRVGELVDAATRVIMPPEPPATVKDGVTMVALSQATVHCLLQRDLAALAQASLISDADYERLSKAGLRLALECKQALQGGLSTMAEEADAEGAPTPTAPGSDRKDH